MEVSPRSQQLAITGPSSLGNKVSDPSIFKKNGTSFGRARKYCYLAIIDLICIWNVEGMSGDSSAKVAELHIFMKKHGIGILCLQETHLFGTHLVQEDGFYMFLSGACLDVGHSYAGVGFTVAPWATCAIVSFRAISEQLATLRVKVCGGVLNIVTGYTLHDGYVFEVRHDFFSKLSDITRRRGHYEESIVLGDFNAQLGYSGEGEEHIVGPFVFRKTLHQNRVYQTVSCSLSIAQHIICT